MFSIILLILLLVILLPILFLLVVAFIYRKKFKLSENFSQIYDTVYEMMKSGNFSFENLQQFQQGASSSDSTGKMSKAQAREILGVSVNASKAEINKAYHALVQKVHPDKGGSHYFAQQLNKARDTLVK
ncbi:J domain-containing protein [Neorickettsia risticii]|uniref:DnaJ domain protein n=1 Tax=Neorickettsia risticii (strain Illinois) TaxID=434131 RepID=C6V5T9_NEORI|nr:DnaJ domain-containing protein [Neorickettsia risticii]ACT69749.1 DnaJ domain protein [Neorickettsia risticii str. Illinois]